MKLRNKQSINNKGFSHLELLIVVLVVIVIAVAGYYVYNHSKSTTTVHAGSNNYTLIGQHTVDSGYYVVKAYACKDVIVTYSGTTKYTKWKINSLVTISHKIYNTANNSGTGYVQLYDWSTNNFGTGHQVAFKQEGWYQGKTSTPSVTVKPGPNHHISFVVQIYNGTQYQFGIPGGQDMGPYAGNLKNC